MARVFNVMIASPGDVQEERSIAEEVIYQWNADNWRKEKIVFVPKRWEKHVSPSISRSAQDHINDKILNDSDLLIAIFWSRMGTPTEHYPSGTMEELQRHAARKKPGIVYFSTRSLPQDSDRDQFEKIAEFKKNSTFLKGKYGDASDFRRKFSADFHRTAIADFCVGSHDELKGNAPVTPPAQSFSPETFDLLNEATQDPEGMILCVMTMKGLVVRTNERDFNEPSTARSNAAWKAVIESLVARRFLEDANGNGEFFKVTAAGFEYVDDFMNEIEQRKRNMLGGRSE